MSENFVYADLSRMMKAPRCAVLCRDVEEFQLFYDNAKEQLAEYMQWDSDFAHSIWEEYDWNTAFTLFESNDDGPYSMTYCYEAWFRDHGYELVEFADLCNVVDIEESEKSFDFLLG